MMSTQAPQANFNPPRSLEMPVQPLPQTVCTTLEHSGLPLSVPENITDIAPDMEWMTQLQLYDKMFLYKITDAPKSVLARLTVFNWRDFTEAGSNPEYFSKVPWTIMPFFGSKWWNGTVGFKFIAIKPPRVTGKLIIRYSFEPYDDFSDDSRYRLTAKEWDLGQSNECEFDITAANTIRARPTWLPQIGDAYNKETGGNGLFVPQSLPIQEWSMGVIRIEAAQRLQVGSIFPDQIRILVFRVYKNTQFYVPTDFRGNMAHSICTSTTSVPQTPSPVLPI